MAEYTGEYGHPYPRVDQYGNPVPPVDQYGNPIPREPVAHSSVGTTLPSSSYGAGETAGYMASSEHTAVSSGEYGGGGGVSYGLVGAEHPHERVVRGAGAAAYPHGVVSSEGGAGGTGAQLQPTRQEEHTATTLGEKLRRSGSSSSSSSSEDDGQGGRRKKKSIKEKIKEKLPGGHKQQDEHAVPAAGAETHAAGKHEKKGIMEKIKEKLPGHH